MNIRGKQTKSSEVGFSWTKLRKFEYVINTSSYLHSYRPVDKKFNETWMMPSLWLRWTNLEWIKPIKNGRKKGISGFTT